MKNALRALILLVAGCSAEPVPTLQQRPVLDEAAVTAIADRVCADKEKYYQGPWLSHKSGDSWFLWRGVGALQISISARDGSTSDCVVVTD